jgi:3-dehydroquinate synthase
VTAATAAALAAQATGTGLLVSLTHRESYPVHIGQDLEAAFPNVLAGARAVRGSGRVHVITDAVVAGHYLERVTAIAGRVGFPVSVHVLPAGEDAKDSGMLLAAWHQMRASFVDRRTLVLAVGGGTVCDIATLAAATYMRGLPYVLVPTTLIAQADAAIGGKGGADFEGVKNLVGTFYHPAAVILDPALLATLGEQHVSHGLAEIIKVAVISDRVLFGMLEEAAAITPALLGEAIRRAVSGKLGLLAADPLERGSLARALNYGHTLGHAVEAASGFTIHHGAAVAMGMATAAAIGTVSGHCDVTDLERIARLLARFRLPVAIPAPLRSGAWEAAGDIRRVRNGQLNLVVPAGIGACAIIPDITRAQYEQAVTVTEQREASLQGGSEEEHGHAARC